MQTLACQNHAAKQSSVACRLYETVHALTPEVLDRLPTAVEPFYTTEQGAMNFSRPQFSHGPWKGYLVGVVGDVMAHEDNVLWPNRVRTGQNQVQISLLLRSLVHGIDDVAVLWPKLESF